MVFEVLGAKDPDGYNSKRVRLTFLRSDAKAGKLHRGSGTKVFEKILKIGGFIFRSLQANDGQSITTFLVAKR